MLEKRKRILKFKRLRFIKTGAWVLVASSDGETWSKGEQFKSLRRLTTKVDRKS